MADILFLPAAETDYGEALAWYAQRSARAAAGFERAVDRALNQIADAPDRWPLCDNRHRFHLLKRYPYSIIYRVEQGGILVVAVAHGRRDPEYWKER
jgi:plasmid stabilization system protein ParE